MHAYVERGVVTYRRKADEAQRVLYLLVCSSRLGTSKSTVLVENRSHGPVIHGPETAYQTAGSVLALQ